MSSVKKFKRNEKSTFHKYNKNGLIISLLWKIILESDRYILSTSGLAKLTHSYINIKKSDLKISKKFI